MSKRRRPLIARAARRLAVALAGAAFLIGAVGFPLPARSAKSSSPTDCCSRRACGCDPIDQSLGRCCCSAQPARAEPEREQVSSCCSEKGPSPQAHEPPSVRWVIGLHQQECRGLTGHWLASGASLPPPPRVSATTDESPAGRVAVPAAGFASAVARPDTPPPRVKRTGRNSPLPARALARVASRPCLNRRDIGVYDEPAPRSKRPAGDRGKS
jgi:hypothetical protein